MTRKIESWESSTRRESGKEAPRARARERERERERREAAKE